MDESLHFQVFHNRFVANSEAIKIAKEINPELQLGCTTTIGPIYPLTPKPEDALQAFFETREMLFFTDVHAFGEYPDYKIKEVKEKNLQLDITKKSYNSLKITQ